MTTEPRATQTLTLRLDTDGYNWIRSLAARHDLSIDQAVEAVFEIASRSMPALEYQLDLYER